MADIKPTRILDVSSNTENNEQQYVEVGSNIYLGTKDGIKYSLLQDAENKFRLVEAPSDASITFSDSSGSLETSKVYESSDASYIKWSESLSESQEIKIISVKSEPSPSPCKGQGDEFGNTVLSPHSFTSSLKKADSSTIEKVKRDLTLENSNNSSIVTYANLYPKEDNKQGVAYYVSPSRSYSNSSPSFPTPGSLRPTRDAKDARKYRMPFLPPVSPYPPMPKPQRGRPRKTNPKVPVYQYTPQFLHSTPMSLTNVSLSSDSSLSLSGCSSSTISSPSLTKSDSSIEYPRVPNNTPTSLEMDSSDNQKIISVELVPFEEYISLHPRLAHNEKERYRRLRIKKACQSIRSFMPWLDEKIDNATAFEESVSFIAFLRGVVGREHDLDFVEEDDGY